MHKLVKSLLLGAPAIIVAAAAAQAADLPANKSAPVEYVRVCDAYGAGFFYIPGTDTCLDVGGYVRFAYQYRPGQSVNNVNATTPAGVVSQIGSAQDHTGMEVRGRVDLDARTQTQWGTVQTVIHLRGTTTDGVRDASTNTNFETENAPGGLGSTSLTVERAYMRFAGLTAGVAEENFSTMPAYMYGSTMYAGFPNGIKQITYTATFGGGFSATISAESKADMNNNQPTGAVNALGYPTVYNSTYANQWDTGAVLVGLVRYDGSWGYAQANVAATENSFNGVTDGPGYVPTDGIGTTGGYAAGFSFRYNLPFISPGDQFHFQFAYADGIIGELFSAGALNNGQSDASSKFWLGGVETVPGNLIATSETGGVINSVGTTQGYTLYGMYTHYWTPQWQTNVDLGYLQLFEPAADADVGMQLKNANVFDGGANLIWSPTKDFNIGVELDYIHVDQHMQNVAAQTDWVAAGEPGLDESGFEGFLRIERQF